MKKISRGIFLSLSLFIMSGCESIGYYSQAVQGQYALLGQRKPIKDLIAASNTPLKLKQQLETVQHIRRFASEHLDLPKNNSYRYYTQLQRKYVVWNVFAAPEFSVSPKRWCFPIAGCVNYRGYFSEQEAQRYATQLTVQGYDTYVAGVAAFSTLGWFDDSVLSTFIDRGELRLAALIFHELAHQKIYLKGDTAFNESFAMAVEIAGVKQWLMRGRYKSKKQDFNDSRSSFKGSLTEFSSAESKALFDRYVLGQKIHEDFVATFMAARERLEQLYQVAMPQDEKRQAKAKLMNEIVSRDYAEFKNRWAGQENYDEWVNQPVNQSVADESGIIAMNNAKLSTLASYHQWLPAFQQLLKDYNYSIPEFYQQVKRLSRLEKSAREKILKQLTDKAKHIK